VSREREPLSIDAHDGDWLRRGSFDLLNHGVDTPEKLRDWILQRGMTVEHFKTLDTYRANVDKLPWLREL